MPKAPALDQSGSSEAKTQKVIDLLKSPTHTLDSEKIKMVKELAFRDIDPQNKQQLKNVFQIKRGMNSSEINWSFTQAKKLSKLSAIVFIVLLALVWPISTYYFSIWSAEYAAQITLEIDNSWFVVIASNGLVGACAIVDTIAFEVIDRVFTKKRFLKTHHRFGFKF